MSFSRALHPLPAGKYRATFTWIDDQGEIVKTSDLHVGGDEWSLVIVWNEKHANQPRTLQWIDLGPDCLYTWIDREARQLALSDPVDLRSA